MPLVGGWDGHDDRTDRPGRFDKHRSAEGCSGGASPASLSGPSQSTTGGSTARSATAHARKGSSRSGVGCGDGPVADRRFDPAGLQPDGHPDRLMSQDHTGWRW